MQFCFEVYNILNWLHKSKLNCNYIKYIWSINNYAFILNFKVVLSIIYTYPLKRLFARP